MFHADPVLAAETVLLQLKFLFMTVHLKGTWRVRMKAQKLYWSGGFFLYNKIESATLEYSSSAYMPSVQFSLMLLCVHQGVWILFLSVIHT